MMDFALLALCFSGIFLLLFLILFFTLEKDDARKIACIACFAVFLAWLLYSAYEGIYIPQWMETISGAPIRVDLLLFIPALIVSSVIAIILSVVAIIRSAEAKAKAARENMRHLTSGE